MAKEVSFRKGETDKYGLFVGVKGEITVDVDKNVAVVHDGETSGGFPMAREDHTHGAGDFGFTSEAAAVEYVSENQLRVLGFDLTSVYTPGRSVYLTQGVSAQCYVAASEYTGGHTVVTVFGGVVDEEVEAIAYGSPTNQAPATIGGVPAPVASPADSGSSLQVSVDGRYTLTADLIASSLNGAAVAADGVGSDTEMGVLSANPADFVVVDGELSLVDALSNDAFKVVDGSAADSCVFEYNTTNGQPNIRMLAYDDFAIINSAGYGVKLKKGTPNGSNNDAGIIPNTDNLQRLGDGGARWDVLYAGTGTINTSDGREKEDIEDERLGLDFVKSLRPVQFRFVGRTRPHHGFIAQEFKAALDSAGVQDHAAYIESDDGSGGVKLGLRYSELISSLVKAMQELSADVETLKAELQKK